MPTDKKYKVQQDVLNDFVATVDANPNLTEAELFKKFPEFNNDANLLQSAIDYHATSKIGKYKTVDELNSKFPEFEIDGLKKKVGTSEPLEEPSSSQPTETEKPKKPLLGFGGEFTPEAKQEIPGTPQVQVQNRPKPLAPTKEPAAEAFLTKKKEEEKPQNVLNTIKEDVKKMASVGVFNTTDLFNKNADVYAEHYLDDQQKQEYGFVKGIQQLQSQLNLDPNNPQLKQQLDAANQTYANYVQQKNAAIDAQIAELESKDYDIADNRKKIETLKAQKEDFFGDKVEKAYTDNKAQIDELKIEGKTPKEQMVNYYLVLQKKAEQLQNKLYPNGIADVVRISTPFLASDYEVSLKKKLEDTEATLKQLSPVVLINRSPLKSDEGFWSSAMKAATNTLLPNTEGVVMTEGQKANLLNAATVQAGINPKDISKGVVSNIEDKAKSERAFTANWWGNLTGTSAGMIPNFMGGAALVKGVPAVAKFNQALNTTKFGRFIAGAVTTGAEYQAAGFLAPDGSTLSDEGSFMSGFMGSAVQQVAGKVIPQKFASDIFNKLFGTKANAAAEIVAAAGKRISAGLGETGEELGNSIGQLVDVYQKTGNWEEVKKQFNDQFGTMDKNLEFFVSTFVMGAAMGHGNQLGQAMSAKAKDQYDALDNEDKGKADEFMAEVNKDIKDAAVETTKEEVAKGAPIPEVVPITEEQKAEVANAKEVLVSPESTPEEKVAAADIVQKTEQQAQQNEVAEALAKAEGLREEVTVEANIEATTTNEVAPISESESNKEFDIKEIAKQIKPDDLPRFQQLSESLREGELLLKDNVDASGKKLTPEKKQQIETSIESTKNKILQLTKEVTNDKETAKREISGKERIGQEPIQTEPNQEGGSYTSETNRVLQGSPEEKVIELTPKAQALLDNSLEEYSKASPEEQVKMVEKVKSELERNNLGEKTIGMGLDKDMVASGQEFLKQVEPKAQPIKTIDTFSKLTELNRIRKEGTLSEKKAASVELRKILEDNPSVDKVYQALPKINKQLEEQELIIKKGDCP